MQDPKKKEEKLQGGDIHVEPSMHRERQHGKLYRWLDNFWYHHKWKTLISLFLAVVILVCTLQMCSKEEPGDVTVLLAGPYAFTEENKYNEFRACISQYMPEECDVNGDGRRAELVIYTLYSKQQISDLRANVDENGNPDPIEVNTYTNSQDYAKYNSYMMTGATSILFLDPWLFEEMAAKGEEYLVDITETFGVTPENGVTYTDANGSTRCLGVRLGDTALYKNTAVQTLPADTVICLMGPFFMGESSNEASYARTVSYYKNLAGITAVS